jgi:antitoxin component YwqK of YwqJK toxin-antitoxin module
MKMSSPLTFAALTLIGFTFSVPSFARILDCEVNGASVNPNNGSTTKGVTGLMRCIERETRLIAREQALVNGVYVGVDKFYEKGKLIRDGAVNAKGNREGAYKTYSSTGILLTDEQYLGGANLGLQKSFYESGSLRRLGFYEKRETASANAVFVDTHEIASIEITPSGKLKDFRCAAKPAISFEKFSDQKLCGFGDKATTELYSDDTLEERRTVQNGKFLVRDWFWSDGKLSGQFIRANEKITERRFNKSGVKISEVISTEKSDGRLRELEQTFHSSGSMISEKQWGANGLVSESAWYLNGQLKSKEEHLASSVLKREYFDSGKLAFEGSYGRGDRSYQAQKEHKHFYESGKLRSEIVYDGNGKVTRERELDESGKIIRDDAVFEDGSRKQFAK